MTYSVTKKDGEVEEFHSTAVGISIKHDKNYVESFFRGNGIACVVDEGIQEHQYYILSETDHRVSIIDLVRGQKDVEDFYIRFESSNKKSAPDYFQTGTQSFLILTDKPQDFVQERLITLGIDGITNIEEIIPSTRSVESTVNASPDNTFRVQAIYFESEEQSCNAYKLLDTEEWAKQREPNFKIDKSWIGKRNDDTEQLGDIVAQDIEEPEDISTKDFGNYVHQYNAIKLPVDASNDSPITINSKEVKVAIIDDGIQHDHPDYSEAFKVQQRFIKNDQDDEPLGLFDDHGTCCAGLICGEGKRQGDFGFFGIAPEVVSLYSVKAFKASKHSYNHSVYLEDLIKGFHWAIVKEEVDVVSCSWHLEYESIIIDHLIHANRRRVDNGVPNGTIVVCAAGNNFTHDYSPYLPFPASLKSVITVTAVSKNGFPIDRLYRNQHDRIEWSSYFGKEFAVSAPALNVVTTDRTNGYGISPGGRSLPDNYALFDGTSAATPIVSGLVALLLSIKPSLSFDDILNLLVAGASQNPYKSYDDNGENGNEHLEKFGQGIIDIKYSISLLNNNH